MRQLTPEGRGIVEDLAQRHGFSVDAVTAMLHAVGAGSGGMAQFDHPEFGGLGQWTQGGMTMIGDMFNHALKARVDGLCTELSSVLARQPQASRPTGGQSQSQSQDRFGDGISGGFAGKHGSVSLFVPIGGRASAGWWPAELGQPSSTGQQNNIRYAVFPAARRLAIDIAGRLSVYDTLDHQIGGVSQQQGGDASLTFTSQHGLVRVAELPIVSGDVPAANPVSPDPPARAASADAAPASPSPPLTVLPGDTSDDIFTKLERLGGLREKGILSEEEFAAKKAELLARL